MPEEKKGSEEAPSLGQERDAYREHWYFVADRIERVALRKDRLIATGAGGALVLSITFLEQVAPNPEPWTLVLLSVSWVSLLAALAVSLWGLYATQRAHEKQQHNLLKRLWGDDSEPSNPWDDRTKAADKWALGCLFAGVGLLAAFAIVNLPWGGSYHRAPEARPAAERSTGGSTGGGAEGVSRVRDSTSVSSSRARGGS